MVAKKTKPKLVKKKASPKKRPTKKKVAKKLVNRPTKKAKLRNAKPTHHFVLKDGRHIRNFLELADAMDDMTDEIFFHHVNNFKNDFAAWAAEVFEDEALSKRLSNIKTRHRHQIEILKHEIKRLIK